ncbi:MAG TPA: ABC transporter ATP-binding protein [Gemmatimonadales bacterium]|nr:ABC transporter ATP-binding protein [Gemmatimonadales bacterium]
MSSRPPLPAPCSPVLSLSAITKRFGPITALDAVDLVVAAGEVHVLLGENGAGKSTLMHVAYGLVAPDAGTVAMDGRPVAIRSPRDARRLGIGMVHQHFTSVPAFTVAENVALGAGWPAWPRDNARRVAELGARLGLPLDPDARAETLPVSLRQRLEIVKALAPGARVLLLDEPTGVLAPAEVEEFLGIIRGFAREGGAVVLITHKLGEALAAADRVTVLRAGRVTLTGPAAEHTRDSLARAMLGAEPPRRPALPPSVGPAVVLRLDQVTVRPEAGRGPGVREVALTVRAGEIVGVAAVEGNGQRELLRAAAGVLPHATGAIDRAGSAVLIPEDRTTEALLPDFSLTENAALGLADRPGWSAGGLMRWRVARERTAALLREHDVRAPGPDAPARALSGGNQQKLVVARALAAGPALVVAENPTRGLDIAATEAVHAELRAVAARGAAVLFHSSDLDEVSELATRVVVMTGGRLVEMGAGAGREEVGRVMVGSKVEGQRSKDA